MNIAIIAAGGKGKRFHNSVPKQLCPMKGKPMLAYSILPFHQEQQIDEVILVIPIDEREEPYRMIIELEQFHKVRIVVGGETRYRSVRNGFESIRNAQENDIVLIHDAARPLLSSFLLRLVLETAIDKGSAIPVTPIGETVKKIKNDAILETVSREDLALAQTPQCFRYEVLKRAYDQVPSHDPTDEAMMVEQSGFPVFVVPGEKQNIKVTDPEDLKLAEYYDNIKNQISKIK